MGPAIVERYGSIPSIKRFLEDKRNGKWVMIIDNITDTDLFFGSDNLQDRSIWEWIPKCSHGRFLINTRNGNVPTSPSIKITRVKVDVLSSAEGAQMLSTLAGDHLLSRSDAAFISSQYDMFPQETCLENRGTSGGLLPHATAVLRHLPDGTPEIEKSVLLRNVARLFLYDGMLNDAEKYFPIRADTALASTFISMGVYDEAELTLEGLVTMLEGLLGTTHPETMAQKRQLAQVFHLQQDHEKAEALAADVLSAHEASFGKEHSETLASMALMASMFHSRGRDKEATDLRAHALEVKKRVLGNEHPQTMQCMKYLSISLFDSGRKEEALKLLESCKSHEDRWFGADHPFVQDSTRLLESWEKAP
ncbi:kinesin light chain [Colletotrichum plurivorum]|uniref:Kinesin light chain n=1 Tax=Colletotrichum plurivorum TaxID=2175906 RepID=A0A8H6NBB5_9PEZI|nr:kinesin light chain [Colletotrichum plurivorum]